MSYIATFNPYSMDDSTVLSVATGRKTLLRQVLKTLEDNLWSSSIAQHLLIRGPRGMGKSFFLKYLQINFRKKEVFEDCEFLLLPEEQNNINSPTDLIKLILSELQNESGAAAISLWEEPDNLWQLELKKLKAFIAQKKAIKTNYQLVVVIENLDEFLRNIKHDKKTRQTYESRFRHLLEKLNDFTIIGATPRIDSDAIDGDYNQRLFHAFKKCNLKRWTEEDYFNYFERRQRIKEKEKGITYSTEQTNLMRAKLKALSHYTGGSPRMAVVLTNLLLEEDVISTAKTLFGLIDDLTPYYQDLTKSIPPKSKILFDTLIRKEENLSQSELAKIVGATQSKISKAFLWLKDNGYIIGKKRSNSPAFSYQVADRIHVLYYQLREIHHNKNITPIWLLSDFLVAFYQEKELREHALQSFRKQHGVEASDPIKVYLLSTGIIEKYESVNFKLKENWIKLIEKIGTRIDKSFEIGNEILLLFKQFRQEKSLFSKTIMLENNFLEGFNNFFIDLLLWKPTHSLLKDLAEEALIIFPEPDTQLFIKAVLNTIKYLENGKPEAFLEALNPDITIAVKVIAQEIDSIKTNPPKSKKTTSIKL